jgi:hypothetical protein
MLPNTALWFLDWALINEGPRLGLRTLFTNFILHDSFISRRETVCLSKDVIPRQGTPNAIASSTNTVYVPSKSARKSVPGFIVSAST